MMIRDVYEQSFEEKKQAMIQQREEWTKKLVEDNLKFHPQASRDVLKFIANILYHGAPEVELSDSAESIRSTFRAGYCYYFALMLKDAFNRGCICWAAPFSHMVWMDTNSIPYDVEGVYSGEAECFIPISYLDEELWSFKHVPNTEGQIREAGDIINEYKQDLMNGNLARVGLLYTVPTELVSRLFDGSVENIFSKYRQLYNISDDNWEQELGRLIELFKTTDKSVLAAKIKETFL